MSCRRRSDALGEPLHLPGQESRRSLGIVRPGIDDGHARVPPLWRVYLFGHLNLGVFTASRHHWRHDHDAPGASGSRLIKCLADVRGAELIETDNHWAAVGAAQRIGQARMRSSSVR